MGGDRGQLPRQAQLEQCRVIRSGRVEGRLVGVKVQGGVAIVKWSSLILVEAHVRELVVRERARVGVAEGAEGACADGGREGEGGIVPGQVQPPQLTAARHCRVDARQVGAGVLLALAGRPQAEVGAGAADLAEGGAAEGEGAAAEHDGVVREALGVGGMAGEGERLARRGIDCRGRGAAAHSLTPSLPHSVTPSHCHSHSLTPSLSHPHIPQSLT